MESNRTLLALLLAHGLVVPAAAGVLRGDAACEERCGDFVVYLEGVEESHSGRGVVVDFDQKDKIFIPHVLPLVAGSTLRIGNSDPYMHNVHAYRGRETVFNVNVLFQYQTLDQVIEEPGIYTLLCDLHPEMKAFIVAFDHPYFASPGDDGAYRIEGVPEGRFTIVRRDLEKDRLRKIPVTVGGGETEVDF